jgi:hypothetical protein
MMRLEDFANNLGPPPDEVRVEKVWVMDPVEDGWYQHIGIGKPGCAGHLRKGNLHALDMGDHWLLHCDRVDPVKDPLGHIVQDAPGVGVALAVIGLVALVALVAAADS